MDNLKFRGQLLQDAWVYHQLNSLKDDMRNGYFVDIGCNDGVKINNTYLFEQMGWSGICIDADKSALELARNNRTNPVIEAVVYDVTGSTVCFEEKDESLLSGIGSVGGQLRTTTSLVDLLVQANAPRHIDYISLDTEGAEAKILQGFEDADYDVTCWTIEHNGDNERASYIMEWLCDRNYLLRIVHWDIFAVKDCFSFELKG